MIGKENKEEMESVTREDDMEMTKEETNQLIRMNEKEIIDGLIEAANYKVMETRDIQITRAGKTLFQFQVRALGEDEYDTCKKKHTKYIRNKHLGMKMPEDTDNVKYRSELIYQATVEEDKKKLWENKRVWDALISKGIEILTPTDVIAFTLMSGEKERVVEEIDRLSGYNSNLEEVTKN